MLVKYHIFLGIALSIILFLVSPNIGFLEASIVFLSSVLIDTDHYFYYIFRKKSFNLKKAHRHFFNARKEKLKMSFSQRSKFYSGWCFLHGIEFLIILFILGIFISRYFFLIFIGIAFHLFLDISEEVFCRFRIDKISSIYDYFKFKKLKRID